MSVPLNYSRSQTKASTAPFTPFTMPPGFAPGGITGGFSSAGAMQAWSSEAGMAPTAASAKAWSPEAGMAPFSSAAAMQSWSTEAGMAPFSSAGGQSPFPSDWQSAAESDAALSSLQQKVRPGQPLRAVHIGPCFCRGGAEQSFIDLAKHLDPSLVRIEASLVTNPLLIDPDVAVDSPVPVVPADAETVRRAADESDIVLFWGVPLGETLSDCRPKLCVYVAHGDNGWTREVLDDSQPVVDHVVAVSRRVQERVCHGFPSTVILNGVDASRLSQTRSRGDMRRNLGFEPDDFVLGFLGRMSWEKRPELLIDAVAQLPAQFKALFVGWGPLRPALLDYANTRIPGRYAFTSASRHLGDFYQALDAFCLLSEHEGFALVLLEAMLAERPIITTDVGLVSELIEDRVNAVVVEGNPLSVRDAALRLHHHPAWANGLAAEGKSLAQQRGHAWRMARDYERFLWRLWSDKFAAARGSAV